MDSQQLDGIYRHRFSEGDADSMARVWRVLVERFFGKWIASTDSVLDYGAGLCSFINHVTAAERVASDANPACRARCADGVAFVEAERIFDGSFDRRFDVVFVSNFLEHLGGPDEVLAILGKLGGVMKPDGRLLVLQPNFALVGARYFDFIDHRTI